MSAFDDMMHGASVATDVVGGIYNAVQGKRAYEYQKWLNEEIMKREDTAITRMAKDYANAGFNKLLAVGGIGSASSSLSSAPSAQFSPSNTFSQAMMDKFNMDLARKNDERMQEYYQHLNAKADADRHNAEVSTAYTEAQMSALEARLPIELQDSQERLRTEKERNDFYAKYGYYPEDADKYQGSTSVHGSQSTDSAYNSETVSNALGGTASAGLGTGSGSGSGTGVGASANFGVSAQHGESNSNGSSHSSSSSDSRMDKSMREIKLTESVYNRMVEDINSRRDVKREYDNFCYGIRNLPAEDQKRKQREWIIKKYNELHNSNYVDY